MTDDTKAIIEKVKKLLALAGRTTSVEEASAATRRAEEIIAKYRLDTATIERADPTCSEPITDSPDPLWVGSRTELWMEVLVSGLSKHYGCYTFVNRFKQNQESARPARAVYRSQYVIVGRPSDVEIVRYMFAFAHAEIVRLSAVERGPVAKAAFRRGAVSAILRGLRETARAAERSRRGPAADLDLRADDAELWFKEQEAVRKTPPRDPRPDKDARARGFRAGKGIHLGPSLPGARKPLPAKGAT
ncbi:MAG: DUF2786 domain-containing protein [Candidatus Fermentibacter sp.]|nr:DUF2786 domain-containing protein [Candidatus Fermentibacter sp.]